MEPHVVNATLAKNLSNHLQKQWSHTPNQTTNNKNVPKRQRNTRHLTRLAYQSEHCHVSFKKTEIFLVNLNLKYTNLATILKVCLEMDEMWGRVMCKKTSCWLWYAINHDTGEIIVYVFGTRRMGCCKSFWFCSQS